MRTICVFCGAGNPTHAPHNAAIEAFADGLVQRGWGLVYGGGGVGLMGRVADRVLAGGGHVLGVIPRQLVAREQGHAGLTELITVDSMHARKAIMYDRSDAFVAFPGGFGTMDEIMEIVTWKQLGIHRKPVIFANLDGYYDGIAAFCERAQQDGLLQPSVKRMADFYPTIEAIFEHLEQHPPAGERAMSWA